MAGLPRALLWRRLDTTGTELVLLDDRAGLYARGTVTAGDPVPHRVTYELRTDESWATVRLTVHTEGAGWLRSASLERAAGRWHVTAGEQGDLDAALRAAGHLGAEMPGCEDPGRLTKAMDVDLGNSPLTNTLPIRRLKLSAATPGKPVSITAAWVLVPSLVVVPATQTYLPLGDGLIRYSSGTFSADLAVDQDGYVRHYPGYADSRPTGGH